MVVRAGGGVFGAAAGDAHNTLRDHLLHRARPHCIREAPPGARHVRLLAALLRRVHPLSPLTLGCPARSRRVVTHAGLHGDAGHWQQPRPLVSGAVSRRPWWWCDASPRILFAYEILTPAALNFFVDYSDGAVESLWSIDQYFECAARLTAAVPACVQGGGGTVSTRS